MIDLIIMGVVLGAVIVAIRSMMKNRKAGCHGNCRQCHMTCEHKK